MSRDLPPRPNLEHLRNQARVLLRAMRRGGASARLADALHAVAREYGFSTWPLLKAHIESLAITPADETFAGTWRADVRKSQRHPLNDFRAATLTIAVSGDTFTFAHVAVDAAGRSERDTQVIHVDGEEHVAAHGNGYVARLRGRRLELEARKDGDVVGRGVYEVSADGRLMTISSAEQRIVWERECPVEAGTHDRP